MPSRESYPAEDRQIEQGSFDGGHWDRRPHCARQNPSRAMDDRADGCWSFRVRNRNLDNSATDPVQAPKPTGAAVRCSRIRSTGQYGCQQVGLPGTGSDVQVVNTLLNYLPPTRRYLMSNHVVAGAKQESGGAINQTVVFPSKRSDLLLIPHMNQCAGNPGPVQDPCSVNLYPSIAPRDLHRTEQKEV